MQPILSASVQSSTIKRIEWFEDQTLRIEFKSGGAYRFLGVPKAVATDLAKAESAGKFFAAKIKGKFPSSKEDAS